MPQPQSPNICCFCVPNNKEAQLKWIKTAGNYLIGRAKEIEHFLNWAGKFRSRTITDYDIATLRNSPWVRRTDPEQFSHDLWSFLKLTIGNVKDRPACMRTGAGFMLVRKLIPPQHIQCPAKLKLRDWPWEYLTLQRIVLPSYVVKTTLAVRLLITLGRATSQSTGWVRIGDNWRRLATTRE